MAEIGRIEFIKFEPRQKPKRLNRKRRRQILKSRGLLKVAPKEQEES